MSHSIVHTNTTHTHSHLVQSIWAVFLCLSSSAILIISFRKKICALDANSFELSLIRFIKCVCVCACMCLSFPMALCPLFSLGKSLQPMVGKVFFLLLLLFSYGSNHIHAILHHNGERTCRSWTNRRWARAKTFCGLVMCVCVYILYYSVEIRMRRRII